MFGNVWFLYSIDHVCCEQYESGLIYGLAKVSAYVFPFGKGAMLWCTPWEQENCKNKSKLCTIRRQTVAALNTFWKSSSWNLIKIEIGATYLKKLFKHLGRKKL